MRRPHARKSATPSALHALVDALPDEALRPLILRLLRDGAISGTPLTAPAEDPESAPSARRAYKRRPGSRPSGRKRGRPGRPRKADPDDVAERIIARRAREARRGPGRPRKVESAAAVAAKLAARRIRNNALARARRAATKPATTADHSNGAGNGNGAPKPAVTAKDLWAHAARISPKTPWRAAAREFGTNEAQALDAYRNGALIPGVTTDLIEQFLELAPTA